MYTIDRNDGDKKGMHLVSKLGDKIVMPLKDVKEVLGYSKKTQDKFVLNKMSESNIIRHYGNRINGKEYIIETYITFEGLKEALSNIKQNSKNQNAKLLVEMIREHYFINKNIENDCNSNKVKKEDIIQTMEKDKGFIKSKWEMLYDIFSDKHSIPNVRHEAHLVMGKNLLKSNTLDYVQYKYPHLMESLYEIAKQIS